MVVVVDNQRRRRRRALAIASVSCLLAASALLSSKNGTEPLAAKAVSFLKLNRLVYKQQLVSASRRSRRSGTVERILDEQENEENENEEQNEEQNEEEENDNEDNNNEDQEENNAEENQEQENEEKQGDDFYAYDDDNGEEDEEDEGDEEDNAEDLQDDYFDDQLQDDQYADADFKLVDDFYAYKGDPAPPTLFPLTVREVIGYFIASMALTLGASGGIGGGGIVVPVYILVMGLPLRVAIPIGAVTVLGGSLGSSLLNWNRRHPLADRPLIDWDLVLVMEPLTLVGTLLGTLFHQYLSEKFLVVLLVLLLSVTAHTTLTKAMRMYSAEKRYIRHLKAAQAEHPPSGSPPRNYTVQIEVQTPATPSPSSTDQQHSAVHHMGQEEKERILILNPDYVTLRSNLMQEEKFTPRTKIIALILMFSVLTFLNVMVGGGAYKSPWGIRCGSAAFWMVHVVMVAFLIASAWAAQTHVVARHEIKELVRLDFVHGDVIWTTKSAVLYPFIFIAAGLFAGTLGIGGGVITVPLMLHFGMHPAVASASSSAMIFFTSFASTTSFVVFGLLLPDFAIVGFCIGFFAALIGQTIMRQARQATSASGRNFERNSYIAFVIGGIVLISALLMTIQYVLTIVNEPLKYDGGVCDGLRL